jgi:carbonic anhydrase
MATSITDQLLQNNQRYARGEAVHDASHPGPQPIRPARRVAVVACMDARIDVEDLLGLRTGEAHVIRNAGGVVNEDVIRSLVISHHLLDTREIVLIHHTRCGMLAFTDDLLRAGLEGDQASVELLRKATGRHFVSPGTSAAGPHAFHAFHGPLEPLDAAPAAASRARLEHDVRRGIAAIVNHPWLPTTGPDAVSVRGFVYDVDTGRLAEVARGVPLAATG